MLKVTMVQHINVQITDRQRWQEWYENVLGARFRDRGPERNTGEHYTYIRDPDGNLIELVYHPLGLVDADGNTVEVATHPRGLRWRQLPEVEAALGTGPAS